jgi:hypothetical protein
MKARVHNGGPCPTHEAAIVRIALRGPGWGKHEHEAGKLRWKHRGDDGDIVRWLFVSGPPDDP